MEGIFPVFSRQNPDYKSNKKNRDRMFWGRKQAEISADGLIQRCMQQNTKHRFTDQDISYYENSPFYLYCNRFVDPIQRRSMQEQSGNHSKTRKQIIPRTGSGHGIEGHPRGDIWERDKEYDKGEKDKEYDKGEKEDSGYSVILSSGWGVWEIRSVDTYKW